MKFTRNRTPRSARWWITCWAALALAACGDGEPNASSGDAGTGDAGDIGLQDPAPFDLPDQDDDEASDLADVTLDGSGDAVADVDDDPDGGLDATPDVTREPDALLDAVEVPESCGEPFEDSLEAGRWSLSMFHYNIQYVAGGTIGIGEIAFGTPAVSEEFDVSAEGIEDLIITESLVPVMAMLERNPDFSLTFEMQGYMVDVIAARHPRVLERMRTLAESGQLELASTHWSDQFFLAFGVEDMDRSWAMTQASFEAADLPLSNVVFTQEGQFGEGFAEWLADRRPDAIMVMARNLQGFYQGDLVDLPLWDVQGTTVILPRTAVTEEISKEFNFFDDGELLATGDLNPYVGNGFRRSLPAVREYEERLRCATHRGVRVGRIEDYVAAAREAEIEEAPMPPFLDGTWQPGSTRGPLRWMGGAGGLSPEHEADNDVLLACVEARHRILAVETLHADVPRDELEEALDAAWPELLWGEVSDARGVNPWWGEVQYGLEHCGNAAALASAALENEAARRGGALTIDTRTGSITVGGEAPPDPLDGTEEVEAPIVIGTSTGAAREIEVTWSRRAEPADDDEWILDIVFRPNAFGVGRYDTCIADTPFAERWRCFGEPRSIGVDFPREPGVMGYRPALSERIVRYEESDFVLHGDATTDAAWTTSADGLIVLGEDAFLVKDVTYNHLAYGFPAGENNDLVYVRDETVQLHREVHWRFYYTTSESRAVALAERNLNPVVWVDAVE